MIGLEMIGLDRVRNDQVRNDRVRNDRVRNDRVRNDQVRNDRVRYDLVRNVRGLEMIGSHLNVSFSLRISNKYPFYASYFVKIYSLNLNYHFLQ